MDFPLSEPRMSRSFSTGTPQTGKATMAPFPGGSSDLPAFDDGFFAKHFTVVKTLGEGAFGRVFHAQKRLDGKEYAIKRVRLCLPVSAMFQSSSILEMALREVQILSALEHPHVLRYYGAWVEQGSRSKSPAPSLLPIAERSYDSQFDDTVSTRGVQDPSMEAFEFEPGSYSQDQVDAFTFQGSCDWTETGRTPSSKASSASVAVDVYLQTALYPSTLHDYLAERTFIDRKRCLMIFSQICEGLEYVHEKGLIHRDLKPSNVFLGDMPATAVIGDFGLARDLEAMDDELPGMEGDESHNNPSLTKGVGTTLYSAPEQLAKDDVGYFNSKVDVFSLGVILVELFTLFETTMERHLTLQSARELDLPPDLPPEIAEIAGKLLSRDPWERYDCFEIVPLIKAMLEAEEPNWELMYRDLEAKYAQLLSVLETEAPEAYLEWEKNSRC